jgi:hypothetical protein
MRFHSEIFLNLLKYLARQARPDSLVTAAVTTPNWSVIGTMFSVLPSINGVPYFRSQLEPSATRGRIFQLACGKIIPKNETHNEVH